MDYTKILSALSRVKDALEKKIDAVNTSVSGLPGTLDTQFTAVKNDIATVKTDVGSVKADTNINLPQKFDAGTQEIKNATEQIKTSVAEISSHIASEEMLPYPRTVVNVRCELGGKKTCVNIKGRGYLNYALMEIYGDSSSGTIYINIDNRAFIMRSNRNDCTIGLLDENEIIGVSSYNSLNKSLALKDFYTERIVKERKSVSLNRVDFIKGKDYKYINDVIFCNGKIQFNKSLEVLGESTGKYAQSCIVSYELY